LSGMRRRSLVSSFGEEETESMVTTNGAPEGEGFGPSVRISPLIELLGPFYFQGTGTDLILGLRVAEKHTNARGFAYGWVLLTLADVALEYAAESSVDPPARLSDHSQGLYRLRRECPARRRGGGEGGC
jgi:hypothetical protein